MRKYILITISLLSSIYSFSQNSKFEIGVSTGPQISGLYLSSKYKEIKPSITFNAGLNVQYRIAKYWLLRSEFDFIQTGHKHTGGLEFGDGDPMNGNEVKNIVTKSNYFSIPLILTFKTNGKVRFFMNTGPCLMLWFANNTTIHYTNGTKAKSSYTSKPLNSYGWLHGMGIEINVSSRFKIPIEVRYLNSISSSNKSNYWEDFKYGTVGLNTGLIYKL